MVVFDNLARILREILLKSSNADDLKEWKLLGQEANGLLVVGWVEEISNEGDCVMYTCIGIYQPKTNDFQVLCRIAKEINIIQASVNNSRSLVSYVVKEKYKEEADLPELYKHYLANVKNEKDSYANFVTESQSFGLQRKKQIMTNFLETTCKDISKLLVFIHYEYISLYRLNKDSSDKVQIIKTDAITKSFSWAQWDCDIQSLYFIHFRKTSLLVEDETATTKETSPTLSCLQFHENLPHETVLNIPLNLPSFPKSTDFSCQIYEDDPLPLRIHDCSLDLIVISDPSGIICICHHYLYQPVKPSDKEISKDSSSVHFAYSVTLLHHGCVIHSVVPLVPWSSAKTLRPVFALLGAEYLVVYAAGIFTHLLDIGLAHEPSCHILMNGTLSMVPQKALRLVPIKGEFIESNICKTTEMLPTVMMDLLTMDLIEFEIITEDLMACLTSVETLSNRLSVLHYFLVHAKNFEDVEEALTVLLKNPTDVNIPKFFQEVLIGGAYCYSLQSLSSDTSSMLKLLPLTCVESRGQIETKVNEVLCTISQEILWNTAMMLLSPQQRLIPFNTDIWKKLWDQLANLTDSSRFKQSQVADKLLVSLGCYQPEALSCCNTPMSPGTGFIGSLMDIANVNQGLPIYKKGSKIDLPFFETESCTASKQEHIISINLRELSLHMLKNCLRESPIHVHAVATRYVAAQLEVSKLLCHVLAKIANIDDVIKYEKGFSLISNEALLKMPTAKNVSKHKKGFCVTQNSQSLHHRQRLLLFTFYQRYYNAADTLAYPLPQGFSSFFCYLGFSTLSFQYFMMFLQNNVFELQIDVMKEIMKDIDDSKEGVNKKLRLLLLLPRSRAKRLLHTWPHGVSLMIRAREHALNILSGIQGTRSQGLPHSRRIVQSSKGLAAFPSADRLSPLDTFLDLLTAKASLTDLDFNLLIDATISSTQDFL